MKHVSFVLRLSHETCFVNRGFIVFLDFVMATATPTADVNSHTDNSTKEKTTTQGLKSCKVVSICSIYFVVSPFSTLTGSNIMFPSLTASLVSAA